MSSMVLSGDTSGTVTVTVPAVAGTNTLTLPAVTGTILTNKSVGTVLQVINGTVASQTSTTSTSYVTTGLSASITPQSTNNKILIIYNGYGYCSGSGQMVTNIYRNSTPLASGTYGFTENNGTSLVAALATNYLDSPSTTSSITYTVYFKSVSGTVYVQIDSIPSSITLMEIAA